MRLRSINAIFVQGFILNLRGLRRIEYAVAAREESLACRESGEAKTIVFSLCGHGHFDRSAYDDFLSGRLEDYEHPRGAIDRSLQALPELGPDS